MVAADALALAELAMRSHGIGLDHASRTLAQALDRIARKGRAAFDLAVERLRSLNGDEPVRCWLDERIEQARPTPRSLKDDLDL